MRFPLVLIALAAGCATDRDSADCDAGAVRAAIDGEIQQGVKATIEEDIDAYMDGVPDDYRIVEDDGAIKDKTALREHALRSWAIIDETIDLVITLDSIEVAPACDEATVITSQRWERMMRRRDDSGSDNVVTTQKHEERWRRKGRRWYNYEIKELGGEIFINGEPYIP